MPSCWLRRRFVGPVEAVKTIEVPGKTAYIDRPATVEKERAGQNMAEILVGVRGFEPPAPASRKQCSTRLSYTPSTGPEI
jgi:hypothetical protein